MTTLVQAVDNVFSPHSQFQSSNNLCNDDGPSSTTGLVGGLFKTMGRINHTYESGDMLSSMGGHSSSGALSSYSSNQSLSSHASTPSFFSKMEELTIQQRHSSGNLYNYGEDSRLQEEQGLLIRKFLTLLNAVQTFLKNDLEAEAEYVVGEEDKELATTVFPKIC